MILEKIEGVHIAESIIKGWRPNYLAFIERLNFGPGLDSSAQVELVGLFQDRHTGAWPSLERPMYRTTIIFSDVQALELRQFGGARVQIMGFDIHAISERRLGRVNFEIEDYEDGRIRFVCSRVQIVRAEIAEVEL